MVREEGFSSFARGITPNVFRSVLMNASQLASYVVLHLPTLRESYVLKIVYRYDFFKSELLATPYFNDNIICHFTASFAAVRTFCSSCTQVDAWADLGNGGNDRMFSCGCIEGAFRRHGKHSGLTFPYRVVS